LHFNGPLVNLNSHSNFHTCVCNQFSKVTFENYTLKTEESDNCCYLIDDGTIVIIRNFVSNDEDTFVIGHKYKSHTDFYFEPCKSSKLCIYLVDGVVIELLGMTCDSVRASDCHSVRS